MTTEPSPIDLLVERAAAALALPPEPMAENVSMRERFMELLVLSFANLFGKTPIAASMLDRTLTKLISEGLEDGEAGRLSVRGDDWVRLEGLVRVQEGQKMYSLNRPSLAVLSTSTSQGLLGEVMEKIATAYANPGPSNELRQATRLLGAYFMTRVARN